MTAEETANIIKKVIDEKMPLEEFLSLPKKVRKIIDPIIYKNALRKIKKSILANEISKEATEIWLRSPGMDEIMNEPD